MPAFEILQVTAQYSNAVLVAILPYVADFAKQLDLPISKPVTVGQVEYFKCSPRTDLFGGRVVLTNGYSFSFLRGRVDWYESPRSYYALQDPNLIPKFYGPVKLTEAQAVKVAHAAILKLGYTDAMLSTDRAPHVTPPPQIGTNVVARYRILWTDPTRGSNPDEPYHSVEFEVDATTGQIQMMGLPNPNSWRPDPKVDVHPPVVGKGPETTYGGGRKIYPVSQAYSNAFLVAILAQFNDYVKKAGFEMKLPITRNDVDVSRCTCGIVEGDPIAFVDLKNGARFVYGHGQVISFYAPDVTHLPGEEATKPIENFFGPINMTTNEAMSLVRETVSKLGYSEKVLHLDEPPTFIGGPTRWGTNTIARCFLNWKESWEGQFRVVAEVDVATKKMKSLYINHNAITNIWRSPPKIDFPPDQ